MSKALISGVDLKENAAGVPCVAEINVGRFYQQSFMFGGAGYNRVQLFFELALNKIEVGHYPIPATRPQRIDAGCAELMSRPYCAA